MTLENQSQSTIDKLVEKAKSIGHDKEPENLDILGTEMVEIMKRTKKIFTAKEMCEITGQKNSKFYSDKMWQCAKKGILVKLPTRGYYKYNFDTKRD